MKLRKPNEAPPGGYYFICEDGARVDGSNLRKLYLAVVDYLRGNAMPVPDDLYQIIEDQICERVPKSFCWKGFGDIVATAISTAAAAVDAVAGTALKQSAKACKSCGKRRRTLNRISS